MKNIFKYSCVALFAAVALGFTACDDNDDDYTPAQWDANASYADVYFPKASIAEELEPTAPTELLVPVKRRNTQGDITVEATIITNSENVFSVEPAHFAAGSDEATFKVTFPTAKEGVPYTLEMSLAGADNVSSWSTGILFSYDVQRVKWNTVGFYYDENGNKVDGMCLYTDDYVTTFFGVANLSYPVKVEERDDMRGYFRVYNPYGEAYPYNEPGDWDDSQDYFLFIDATNAKKVYIPRCVQGADWGYGNFICYSLAGYYLDRGNAGSAASYYGSYANGEIKFPTDALLFGMSNYNDGGLYGSNGNGAWSLVINPDLVIPEEEPAYEADIEEDFEWEEVFVGSFKSGITGNQSEVALMKGTCMNTTDDCDKTFAETYGTAYALLDPYGPDAPIYFGVKEDGTVTNPYPGLQATGMKALSEDVYATINTKKSSFSEKVITLNMTFQNLKGDLVYGTANETLSNITWTLVGTGTYLYSQFLEADDPGLELFQRDDMPNLFKIEHWGYDVDFAFSWDQKTNEVVVADQFMGYTHPSYGDVWVDELSDYAGEEMMPSYFDPETNTFNFGVVYYVSAGNFGYGYETFTLDAENAAAPMLKAPAARGNFLNWQAEPMLDLKRASKLVGKKVDVKSTLTVESNPLF